MYHHTNVMSSATSKLWHIISFLIIVVSFLSYNVTSRALSNDSQLELNERPIIGVLTQTNPDDQDEAYVFASYVRWVESAGARVVPVLINQKESYYDKLYESINGVLFPGGNLTEHTIVESPTGKISNYFYQRSIKEFDKKGDYFPVWGTCQGLELLSQLTAGKDLLANTFNTTEINLPLVLHKGENTVHTVTVTMSLINIS
ncbi:gamma-glutamyl hydrolase-like [Amphiura filiformis]|uniref:gamma-glutamyl hydrolase-like n=1 Tax=Amphiura filiformis TaxID=82378 RepID=UPI003B2194B2